MSALRDYNANTQHNKCVCPCKNLLWLSDTVQLPHSCTGWSCQRRGGLQKTVAWISCQATRYNPRQRQERGFYALWTLTTVFWCYFCLTETFSESVYETNWVFGTRRIPQHSDHDLLGNGKLKLFWQVSFLLLLVSIPQLTLLCVGVFCCLCLNLFKQKCNDKTENPSVKSP